MGFAALFASTPKIGLGNLTVANTNRDGTGTIVACFTAGASGSRIDQIKMMARATTTAGMLRLFIYDGTTAWLWKEVPVQAITPGATQQGWTKTIASGDGETLELPLMLPTGYSLRAAMHNAESTNVEVQGGDF